MRAGQRHQCRQIHPKVAIEEEEVVGALVVVDRNQQSLKRLLLNSRDSWNKCGTGVRRLLCAFIRGKGAENLSLSPRCQADLDNHELNHGDISSSKKKKKKL